MKRAILFGTLCLLFVSQGAWAQRKATYNHALGLRAGGTSGITYKHFISSSSAIEGILGFWYNGISLTGLYEGYAPTGLQGLKWYYGGGAHVATYSRYDYVRENRYWYRNHTSGYAIGIDGIVGLEYKIPPIPVAISFDLKPTFEIGGSGYGAMFLDPGFGLKFLF